MLLHRSGSAVGFFWDERMVQHSAVVIASAIILSWSWSAMLWCDTRDKQRPQVLSLLYLPSFNPGRLPDAEFELVRDGLQPPATSQPLTATGVADSYMRKLAAPAMEIVAGNTLYGPHQDDLRLLANGGICVSLGAAAQQRRRSLALKLAELQAMTQATGDAPLLLLDDVMSELDEQRRGLLLSALAGVEQTIVTTTDLDDFTPLFRAQAQIFSVMAGAVATEQRYPRTIDGESPVPPLRQSHTNRSLTFAALFATCTSVGALHVRALRQSTIP
ncbi:MAG: hypothetical protein IPK16_10715 [Anaerolineales bacterium]|nr:hypothetical protein [Anaerolineales bacterium]